MAAPRNTSSITQVDDFSRVARDGSDGLLRDEQGLIVSEPQRERAVVVGVELRSEPGALSLEDSLTELELLSDTAGIDVVARLSQRMQTPNPASLVGEGKVAELAEVVADTDVGVVIFDAELSPRQQRVLEAAVSENVKVIDRTALILDIFAKHARTREGIVQVELAQYQYRLPRLTRAWTHLARQAGGGAGGPGGGVGLRGPGETQLELDRRQITSRIARLNAELETIKAHRLRTSARRTQDATPRLGLVGYTNAGKSTLLNRLTDASVYADDLLFATLDPITRKLKLPKGQEAFITDTVGFIQKLPTSLVAAFRATLESVNEADLLLHVVDATHPNLEEHINVVEELLDSLGAGRTPMILVPNKTDLLATGQDPLTRLPTGCRETYQAVAPVSAVHGTGVASLLDTLVEVLASQMEQVTLHVPYARGDVVSLIHRYGQVESESYDTDGTHLVGRVPQHLSGKLSSFVVN